MTSSTRNRTVHAVGSLPANSAKEAFELLRDEVGERLGPTVPDGQSGGRSSWVRRIVEGLRFHPAVELERDGSWASYDDIPIFRVLKGRKLRWVDLDYLAGFEQSWPEFQAFNAGGSRRLQIGIPSPAGLAYVAFGMNLARAAPNVAAFREATIREVAAIDSRSRGNAVFQLDLPVELATVARVLPAARELVAAKLASEALRLVDSAPRGASFGLHLCLGDLRNEALIEPANTGPAVALANAIMKEWPPGRTLEYLHMGLAPASRAPTLDPDYYSFLKRLWIPPEVRFIGGFVHEKRTSDELVLIRDELDHLLRREVDIAASCGLGLLDPETGRANLRLARQLAEAPSANSIT